MAQYAEETTLKFLLLNCSWSGGPGFREEPLEQYLHERMRAAVRRLPHSEDLLADVLAEIVAEMEG
jgi:hypothetical protein